MRRLSRPRLISSLAALALTILARTADAQTVIVRTAPAGAMIELTMNGGAPVTATANGDGDATLAVPARSAEADVQIHVDSCGNLVRVVMVERGVQPTPAAAGCNRTDFPSTFMMRPVTTFVVDMADQNAQVHITQGPPPPEWVLRGAALERARIHWGTPSDGLTLSAGVGLSSFQNITTVWCGSSTSCEDSSPGGVVSLGAEFWIRPTFGAQITYLKPSRIDVTGSGDTYHFESQIASRIMTIEGKAGARVGPVRFVGHGGLNRHESTQTTTQTNDDTTVTVDNVTQTIKGGTQNFAQKTRGWNWVVGGGAEAWFSRWIAMYGDLTIAKIKGNVVTGGEGEIDDQSVFVVVGLKVRLWK